MNLKNKKYSLNLKNNINFRFTLELYFPIQVKIKGKTKLIFNVVSSPGYFPFAIKSWHDEQLEMAIKEMIKDARSAS